MSEQLTTFEEDFDAMRTRLVGMGAGQRAVAGTIIDDGMMMRGVYHVDETVQPPVISELIIPTTDAATAMLTRATVVDDEPLMAKRIVPIGTEFDLATQLEFALMGEQPELRGGANRELPFTYMYDYVMGFEPNA